MYLPNILRKWLTQIIFGKSGLILDQIYFESSVFFDGSEIIILTHAFQKKTQKIPRQAIIIAEKRMKDYFKRKES